VGPAGAGGSVRPVDRHARRADLTPAGAPRRPGRPVSRR
jgi:hypothetical protein